MFSVANLANAPALLAALNLPTVSLVETWSPSSLFPGWVSDGFDITIPLASFSGLTADQANGITGDARAVMLSLYQTMFGWYNDLETKPVAIVPKLSYGSFRTSGDFIGKTLMEFSCKAYADYPSSTIADEPGV